MPHLDERKKRLLAAAEARVLGVGGVSLVSRVSGLSRDTIYRGLAELDQPTLPEGRVRRAGAGRKRLDEESPKLLERLKQLVAPATRGDPESPLQWTSMSTRQLASALRADGYRVSHATVGKLLKMLGFGLQANAKRLEGKQHPDRDGQFHYIEKTTQQFFRAKQPVISVDSKKKELIGQYANRGREWRPQGQPECVQTYDFPSQANGKAIPYGVYDPARNEGWVNVGCDHDTATFAVESIRRWWRSMGRKAHAGAKRLLICADGGGSNGSRIRLWKYELQQFADETGLEITVCHYPPGTSKWNKIEHRLFSHITMNWRGRPLVSHEVVVSLIGATTTSTGLRVRAGIDKGAYPLRVKVSKAEMAALRLTTHAFHGEWNYSLTAR